MGTLRSDAPEFFPRGPGALARLTLVGAISLLLMFLDIRYRYLEGVRSVVATALAPVQRLAAMPGEALVSAARYFADQQRLMEENRTLSERLLAQAASVQGYETLRQENSRLRRLVGVASSIAGPMVGAEVLYTGRDPFAQRLVIDKGRRDALQPGMAVIDDRGVLGQVTRVHYTVAEVTLLTDKDHAVPVQVERSGVRTVLQGSGIGRLPELRYLPPNADVAVGDRLVTSGIDGVYPSGLAVAEVVGVERDPGRVFARVTCRPLAGIDRSRQVMVVGFRALAPRPPEGAEDEPPRKAGAKVRRGG